MKRPSAKELLNISDLHLRQKVKPSFNKLLLWEIVKKI